jgi:hypothetical protein
MGEVGCFGMRSDKHEVSIKTIFWMRSSIGLDKPLNP